MDDEAFAIIADRLAAACPANPVYTLVDHASADAASVVKKSAPSSSSEFVRLVEMAVEFGYGAALQDIRTGRNESFGYSHREV